MDFARQFSLRKTTDHFSYVEVNTIRHHNCSRSEKKELNPTSFLGTHISFEFDNGELTCKAIGWITVNGGELFYLLLLKNVSNRWTTEHVKLRSITREQRSCHVFSGMGTLNTGQRAHFTAYLPIELKVGKS